MPISVTPITAAQYDVLQENINSQASQFSDISDIALSGLNYIVLLNVAQPELDLLNPFYQHLLNVDSSTNLTLFQNVSGSLNNHVVQRATSVSLGDQSARLNSYLSTNSLTVKPLFAQISSGGGYYISAANVDPIVVISPNGTESWTVGTTHDITWTAPNGGSVLIDLYNNGVFVERIATVKASTGVYSWDTTGQTTGTTYRIRVTHEGFPSVFDSSNADFSLV